MDINEIKEAILIALFRGEAVLVHKDVTEEKVEAIKNFLLNSEQMKLYGFQLLNASDLEKLDWSERNSAARDNAAVLVIDVDLDSKEQERVFSHFWSRFQSARWRRERCSQILITKPGSTEKISASSSFFNWTNNI